MSGTDRDSAIPRFRVFGFRSGFVAIVGRPNVGKSALLNRLAGQRLAIVTPVPQTTRSRLQGIVTLPTAQLILIDTPGFHEPRHRLGARMVEDVRAAAADADVILWVIDASVPPTPDDELVAAVLRMVRAPIVLALNKVDRLPRGQPPAPPAMGWMPVVSALAPVSAATGAGGAALVETLIGFLPEGPQFFPPEMATDQQERRLVAEAIREQAMLLTREEVPHGIAVEIEELTPREGQDLIYIRAVVFVERDAHRKILIGAGGRMLREIGRRARARIESLLGARVYLDLWVKVAKDWRTKDALIERLV
ncbi:MAG TPA: GTPase Era [bacterium]|nr:GTPase Era [bacterium]